MSDTPPPAEASQSLTRRVASWFQDRWTADAKDPVDAWKDAWVSGMHARWNGSQPSSNPYEPLLPAFNAWSAGWRWAAQQPDRRSKAPGRLAHPRRRRDDGPSISIGAASTATVGISTAVVAGWLWAVRRKRRSSNGV